MAVSHHVESRLALRLLGPMDSRGRRVLGRQAQAWTRRDSFCLSVLGGPGGQQSGYQLDPAERDMKRERARNCIEREVRRFHVPAEPRPSLTCCAHVSTCRTTGKTEEEPPAQPRLQNQEQINGDSFKLLSFGVFCDAQQIIKTSDKLMLNLCWVIFRCWVRMVFGSYSLSL